MYGRHRCPPFTEEDVNSRFCFVIRPGYTESKHFIIGNENESIKVLESYSSDSDSPDDDTSNTSNEGGGNNKDGNNSNNGDNTMLTSDDGTKESEHDTFHDSGHINDTGSGSDTQEHHGDDDVISPLGILTLPGSGGNLGGKPVNVLKHNKCTTFRSVMTAE